jgi:hypothetical protein
VRAAGRLLPTFLLRMNNEYQVDQLNDFQVNYRLVNMVSLSVHSICSGITRLVVDRAVVVQFLNSAHIS